MTVNVYGRVRKCSRCKCTVKVSQCYDYINDDARNVRLCHSCYEVEVNEEAGEGEVGWMKDYQLGRRIPLEWMSVAGYCYPKNRRTRCKATDNTGKQKYGGSVIRKGNVIEHTA
jgi:hypothetical protein